MKKTLLTLAFGSSVLSGVPMVHASQITNSENASANEIDKALEALAATPVKKEVESHIEEIKKKQEKAEEKLAAVSETETTVSAISTKKETLESEKESIISKEEAAKKELEALKAELEAKKKAIIDAEEARWASLYTGGQATVTGGTPREGEVKKDAPTSNTYPWYQCTWGVKNMLPWVGPYWGNANMWDESAAAEGFSVGYTPKVGAVAVWNNGYYGHVAVVTAVDGDKIQVMEANYGGSGDAPDTRGIGNYRGWFTDHSIVYIYPKG